MIPLATNKRGVLITSLVASSLGHAALAIVGAWCVQNVFDELLSQGASRPQVGLATTGTIFVSAGLFAGAIEIYRAWAAERLGLGYTSDIRAVLFERILNASPAALRQRRDGDLLMPFVGDLTAIKKWVSDGLVRLISAVVTAGVLLAALASVSPLLAALSSLILVAFALAAAWLSDPLSRAIRETRSKRGAVANFVASSIRAAATIQAFDRFSREARRLQRRNTALMESGLRLARISGATSAISHIAATALVGATLAIGAIEVRGGAMSVGLVAAAMSVAALLANSVRDLGTAFELWRRAQAAFAKISATMELQPSVAAGVRADRKDGEGLLLDALSVAGLFENVNAEAPPRTVTILLGGSGAGKSTLLATIAGLHEPDGGTIRLAGRDLRRESPSWVRRRIGIASAAAPLLRGTIAMNLRYRARNASQEEIDRVIESCSLQPILDRLPQGERTRLSEGVPELARGEVQRLLIARAMLGSPSLLLLDDVDTHLDDEARARLATALRNFDGTIIMTAASQDLQALADSVWRLERGQVLVESPNRPGPGETTSEAGARSAEHSLAERRA